ncbi:membrane protein [Pelistega indica]|uniref:Membrane protein n=1 Tax=Pelistega indica TaxID=1414851 RepID=V8FS17_9BURK|nr:MULTISPECIES: OmpA family protein [Pelistega]ETD66945.1 membrane protein [Pelistega indica]
MKYTRLAAVVLAGSVFAGCASTAGNTAAGTGIGAALGAGVGALIGDNSKSAAIGAGIGAVAGAITGYNWDRIVGKVDETGSKIGVSTTKMPDGSLKVNFPEGATFDTGSAQLKSTAYPVLDALASEMTAAPTLRVKVIGHTDNKGTAKLNQKLSESRAQSVVSYLATKGVDGSRAMTEGRGFNDPIADNGTEEGRAQNRRVEVYLYAVQQ